MNGIESGAGLQQIIALRRQIVDRSDALRSLREADSGAGVASATDAPPAFADTLRTALQEVNATQQRAADLAAAYERGEMTDVAQVMLARQEAGVAFEATLQVRNKLLSAYQDIMRMGA